MPSNRCAEVRHLAVDLARLLLTARRWFIADACFCSTARSLLLRSRWVLKLLRLLYGMWVFKAMISLIVGAALLVVYVALPIGLALLVVSVGLFVGPASLVVCVGLAFGLGLGLGLLAVCVGLPPGLGLLAVCVGIFFGGIDVLVFHGRPCCGSILSVLSALSN